MPLDAKPGIDPRILQRRNEARAAFFDMRHVLRRISMDEEIMGVVSRETLAGITGALEIANVVQFLDL